MLDLSIFCDPSDYPYSRYPGLRKPFRIDEWIYATDGRICVRMPGDKKAKPIGKVPEVNELFRKFKAEACTEPWPAWDHKISFIGSCDVIAPQRIAGRLILGLHWFKVSSLGEVLYDPTGTKENAIHFVCDKLQGIVMPRADG